MDRFAFFKKTGAGLIVAKTLYLIVFISNMICIIAFLTDPEGYIYSYQVKGSLGAIAAIQGFGVAFAMWNVTYPFYIFSRKNNKTLGLVIIVQQVVGLIGELYIQSGLSSECEILYDSIERFVFFDAGGLVLLLVGFVIAKNVTAADKTGDKLI